MKKKMQGKMSELEKIEFNKHVVVGFELYCFQTAIFVLFFADFSPIDWLRRQICLLASVKLCCRFQKRL
jgi:hypothetical protein